MVQLIQYQDVMDRLQKIPNLVLPTRITPELVQGYIEEATGSVLNASGFDDPPMDGTRKRQALNGLCVRLVVNMVRGDLFSMDAQMSDVLLRERNSIVKEAETVTTDAAVAKAMLEIAGAQ